jgi:galactofuranose transport system ATP-binding protein
LADNGLAVLMISSEFEELVEGADRVIVIQEGQSVDELAGENLTENAIIKSVSHISHAKK